MKGFVAITAVDFGEIIKLALGKIHLKLLVLGYLRSHLSSKILTKCQVEFALLLQNYHPWIEELLKQETAKPGVTCLVKSELVVMNMVMNIGMNLVSTFNKYNLNWLLHLYWLSWNQLNKCKSKEETISNRLCELLTLRINLYKDKVLLVKMNKFKYYLLWLKSKILRAER